jgi:hypothetical protein
LAQESESKVDVYTSRRVQVIPKRASEMPSVSVGKSAEKRKKQVDEPLYIDRI